MDFYVAQRNAWVIFNCAGFAYEYSTFRRRIYCLCFVSLHSVSVIVHLCMFLSQTVLLFLGTRFVNSSVIMTY